MKTRGLLLIPSVLLITSCATDSQVTRGQGAAAGGILGAVLGAAVGHNYKAALEGGAGGAGLGYIVGDQVAREKNGYVQREDALQQSADRAHQLATAAQAQNRQLADQVLKLRQSIDALQRQQMNEQSRRYWLNYNQQQADGLLAQTNTRLSNLQAEIAHQQSVRTQAQQSGSASAGDLQRVANGIRELQSNEHVLEEARAQLEKIDTRRVY